MEKGDHLFAPQLTLQHGLPRRVSAMHLQNTLTDVEPNCAYSRHERPPIKDRRIWRPIDTFVPGAEAIHPIKLSDIDPEAYLADIFTRLATGHPVNRLEELLPWTWATSHKNSRAA